MLGKWRKIDNFGEYPLRKQIVDDLGGGLGYRLDIRIKNCLSSPLHRKLSIRANLFPDPQYAAQLATQLRKEIQNV